jgi:hypothetical protein
MLKSEKQTEIQIAKALKANLDQERIAREIAFHMTDWRSNLLELIKIYDESEDLSNDEIYKILLKFLAHVPDHVAAAKKLIGMGPIKDIFNVGIMEEDE